MLVLQNKFDNVERGMVKTSKQFKNRMKYLKIIFTIVVCKTRDDQYSTTLLVSHLIITQETIGDW